VPVLMMVEGISQKMPKAMNKRKYREAQNGKKIRYLFFERLYFTKTSSFFGLQLK